MTAPENSLQLARQVQQRLFPTSPGGARARRGASRSRRCHRRRLLRLPLAPWQLAGHGHRRRERHGSTGHRDGQTCARARRRATSPTPPVSCRPSTLLPPDLGEPLRQHTAVDIDPQTRGSGGLTPARARLRDRPGPHCWSAPAGVVLGLFDDAAYAVQRDRSSARRPARPVHRRRRRQRRLTAPCAAPVGPGVVRAHAHATRGYSRALCEAVKRFADGAAQHDDVTAVCRVPIWR
jgi:hypothetical protein